MATALYRQCQPRRGGILSCTVVQISRTGLDKPAAEVLLALAHTSGSCGSLHASLAQNPPVSCAVPDAESSRLGTASVKRRQSLLRGRNPRGNAPVSRLAPVCHKLHGSIVALECTGGRFKYACRGKPVRVSSVVVRRGLPCPNGAVSVRGVVLVFLARLQVRHT